MFTFVSLLDPVPLASCNECRLPSGLLYRVIPRSHPLSSLEKPCFKPRDLAKCSSRQIQYSLSSLVHTPKILYRYTRNKKWPQREAQKHCDDIHEAYEIPFSNLPNVGGSQNPIKVALQKTNLIRLFLWLSIWSWCALFLPIESGPLSKYGL